MTCNATIPHAVHGDCPGKSPAPPADLAALTLRNETLVKSLTNLMALIDEGVLVRDISRDAESSWHMRMLALVNVLAEARAALKVPQ